MSDRKTHQTIGSALAATLEFSRAMRENEPLRYAVRRAVLAGAAGAIGGIAPDVLEPADSPNHRGVCHSWTLGTLIMAGFIRGMIEYNNNLHAHRLNAIPRGFGVGYQSHLALDALTPKGLPLI